MRRPKPPIGNHLLQDERVLLLNDIYHVRLQAAQAGVQGLEEIFAPAFAVGYRYWPHPETAFGDRLWIPGLQFSEPRAFPMGGNGHRHFTIMPLRQPPPAGTGRILNQRMADNHDFHGLKPEIVHVWPLFPVPRRQFY